MGNLLNWIYVFFREFFADLLSFFQKDNEDEDEESNISTKGVLTFLRDAGEQIFVLSKGKALGIPLKLYFW